MFATPLLPAPRLKRHIALMSIALAAGAAHAEDTASIFSFSGFGTAAMTHSSSDQGDFVSTRTQANGAGRTRRWSTTDSEIGAQLTATFNDRLSAVVQVVAAPRVNNHFSPRLEWAFIKYKFTPDLELAVGRSLQPNYASAESRLVGFTQQLVRPPVEVYSGPTTNMDGLNGSWHHNFGPVSNTLTLFYGKTKAQAVNSFGMVGKKVIADPIRGIVNQIEVGSWSARAGMSWVKAEFSLPNGPFIANLTQGYIGATYDPGNWYITAETAKVADVKLASDSLSAYVTAGMRVNAFTPYVLYARVKPTGVLVPAKTDQSTAGVGLRWDAIKNIAFKAQFEHVKVGAGSFGTFTNVKPGMMNSSSNVATLTADFVF